MMHIVVSIHYKCISLTYCFIMFHLYSIIQDHWSPIYTVSTILTSIQSLLTDPNPASPANPEAAKLWASDKKEYRKRVRACVAKCSG